jgi:transcriptional regulator with XRE-family HTH domain
VAPYLRLTHERRKRGWTQAELARRVKECSGPSRLSHQAGISFLEVGHVTLTDAELEMFGQIFGVSPAFVLLKPIAVQDPDERVAELSS